MSDFKTINLHAVDAVLTVIYFCAVYVDQKLTRACVVLVVMKC